MLSPATEAPTTDRTTAANVAGTATVHVARAGGRSVVTRAFAASPLRLLTPRNHGDAAWVYSATYGGGLVDGDDVRIDVRVGSGATMLLATQAATKVYRSTRGAGAALHAVVEPGALLAVVPDPVICFAGAAYRQEQRIDLHDHAALVYLDWCSSGRHASGERWRFDRYESRLEIRRCGRLAALDAVTLAPEHGDVAARMGRFDVLAVIAVVGERVQPDADELLRRVSNLTVEKRARTIAGASAIRGGGCFVRMAGTSVEDVGRTLRAHLRFLPALLGDDPWARKW
ncbi:MAG TPA: urease accessory protein UreD [Vicinamibacterales bacterium]|nr:urease accessory protein UreD [Vicinamibacterales bacterium]